MGIKETIDSLDPKLKQLFMNIILVSIAFIVLFTLFTIVTKYNMDIMMWLSSPDMVTTIVLLIFVGMAYMVLSGKELKADTSFIDPKYRDKFSGQSQPQKTQPQHMKEANQMLHTPKKRKRLYKKPRQQIVGTWKCPNCGNLAKGSFCQKCNYQYKE